MTETQQLLGSARVKPVFPHEFGRNVPVPASLAGATIVQVGTYEDSSLVEGGGLVIDYVPTGKSQTFRLTMAMNDVAMWVVYHHPIH